LAQDAATKKKKNYVDTTSKRLLLLLQNSGLYGTSYRFYYHFNTNAGGFEVTLPAAADNTGKVYVISDDGIIFLYRKPAVLANGNTVPVVNVATSIRIQSNGTSWLIIN
jgi:hypothetical protein